MPTRSSVPPAYEVWRQVREALRSINMQMENWQPVWKFDFSREHDAGTASDEAAMKGHYRICTI